MKIEISSNNLGLLDEKINSKVRDVTDHIFQISQGELTTPKVIQGITRITSNTGYLLGSGRVQHTKNTHTITYDAPYASDIEYGSEPHVVDLNKLKRWARQRLGNESLAVPIQRSIAKNGTPAQPFLRPALEKAINEYR